MRSRRRSASKGFTLVELLAVGALIAILLAMATARLDFLVPQYRLRGAAREVGSILKQARSRAASTGRDVYAQFEVSKLDYWLLVAFPLPKEDGSLPGPDEPAVYEYQETFRSELPEGVHFTEVILGKDQAYSGGRALVRISPFGLSNHVIVNLQLDDRPIAVKMNGLTGVITYHEDHQSADELIEDMDE